MARRRRASLLVFLSLPLAAAVSGLSPSPARAASGSGGGTESTYVIVHGEHTQVCFNAREIVYQSGPDYRGSYTDPPSGVTYKGKLRATARWSSFESPDGSFTGPDCKVPGRHPTTATVEGTEPDPDSGASKVSCLYTPQAGSTYQRTGPTVNEDLRGTCTITARDGKAFASGTHEVRRRVLQRSPPNDAAGQPRPPCDGMPPKQCWTVDSFSATHEAAATGAPGPAAGPARAGGGKRAAPAQDGPQQHMAQPAPGAAGAAPGPAVGPPPVVTKLDPASGPAVGKRVVRVAGSGFVGVLRVFFGDTAVSQRCGLPSTAPGPCFEELSPTELRVVSPSAPPGRVPVVVETPLGASPKADAAVFEYVLPTKPAGSRSSLTDRVTPTYLFMLAGALLAATGLIRSLVSRRRTVGSASR